MIRMRNSPSPISALDALTPSDFISMSSWFAFDQARHAIIEAGGHALDYIDKDSKLTALERQLHREAVRARINLELEKLPPE